MKIWMENIGQHTEREGIYLICPINSATKQNNNIYRIMEEPRSGDMVIHHVLERASKKPTAFNSFSIVKRSFYITNNDDPYCDYPPPYRKIDLERNRPFKKPITMEMLLPFREKFEQIDKEAGLTRTPFDKNFRMKQLYLGRIPIKYLEIFGKLSKTTLV